VTLSVLHPATASSRTASSDAGTTDKAAATSVPLHPLLTQRWSPRSFDAAHQISSPQLMSLLEAARWAPSANNSQPWRFVVGRRGSRAFDYLYEALNPGNRVWAGAASALVLVGAATVDAVGTPRSHAVYDTGQAVAQLVAQAGAEGLSVHQMAGFDADALTAAVELPAGVIPLVVVAVGRRTPEIDLPEPFAARERAARTRLPLDQLLLGQELESRTA